MFTSFSPIDGSFDHPGRWFWSVLGRLKYCLFCPRKKMKYYSMSVFFQIFWHTDEWHHSFQRTYKYTDQALHRSSEQMAQLLRLRRLLDQVPWGAEVHSEVQWLRNEVLIYQRRFLKTLQEALSGRGLTWNFCGCWFESWSNNIFYLLKYWFFCLDENNKNVKNLHCTIQSDHQGHCCSWFQCFLCLMKRM